jgi:isoquinoline 1-oxidoreductase subunit beta
MYGRMINDAAMADPALDRRSLFRFAAVGGAGLALGLFTDLSGTPVPAAEAQLAPGTVVFNPFVRITPDNRVIVVVKHLDKGQGAATGLATLVADELDAAHPQVSTEFAPANAALYKNLFFGVMGTGGSTAMANSWVQYRQAGAEARWLIVQAAAAAWKVSPAEISIQNGIVKAGSKTAGLGDFADAAAKLTVPATVKPKDPKAWTYIGKSFPRVDAAAKVSGKPMFTQDVKLPDMAVAVIARPTKFGAGLRSVDDTKAKAVKGVIGVYTMSGGNVGVIATSTWAAIKGREALKITYTEPAAEVRGTDQLLAEYQKIAGTPGKVAKRVGDVEAAFKGADKVIEADYSFPYLAHAPMEPMNCAIQLKDGRVTIWTGSQMPNLDQVVAASILGVKPEAVTVNTLWAGGSFGRRAVPNCDYVAEAADLLRAWGTARPLKVIWTREDDIAGGYYRPMMVHKVKAGIDKAGRIVAWHHRVVGQPILIGTPFEGMLVKGGIDPTMTEGVEDTPYAIPNLQVEQHQTKVGVPVLWWRSVGHTHTAYVVETMMDQLAKAAGQNPLEFRLAHLAKAPRHAAVLRLAAEKAGWGTPAPEGIVRGIAVHESFKTHVAQVAEVRMVKGMPKVERVVCVVDCGIAINPDNIRSQMEGGIGFGLGAIMRSKITLKGGVVEQRNFDGYEVLRMEDMPKVEVHIMPSTEPPTGVGEPGVPPIGPAIANAIATSTGRQIRALPIADGFKST